jgi:hypothetical protein
MVIKYTFSIPLESIRDCAKQVTELSSLPEFITLRGPYINDAVGAENQIIALYEFDKSKFPEALQNISKQLDAFQGIRGLTFSAQVAAKGDAEEIKLSPFGPPFPSFC